MHIDRTDFLNQLKSSRRSEIEKKLNDFNARLEVERKKRLAERKEQRCVGCPSQYKYRLIETRILTPETSEKFSVNCHER